MIVQPTLDPFIGADSLKSAMELYVHLNDQVFSTKDLNVLSRTVVSWENEGLIDIKRANRADWRRLSFMEFFWIEFVNQMREIGLRLPVIAKVKAALLHPMSLEWIIDALKNHPEKQNRLAGPELRDLLGLKRDGALERAEISVFHLLAVGCILERKPVSVLVFMDGTAIPWLEGENPHWSEEMLSKRVQEPYVSIPLLSVFRDFLSNPRTQFAIPKLNLLNEDEQYLLEQVHSGKYSSITINFKDQKMKSLELVKEQDVKARITDVIADASYQDITIKTHGGRVTKIENTVKVTF